MDPKRIRLIAIAVAIPVLFVAAVSIFGGEPKKGGPVVVTNGGATGAKTPRPSSTEMGLTLEDLIKGGTPKNTGGAIVTPTLPPADPKVISELMEKGERNYMSGDLAAARGFYDRAVKMDPKCERCAQKLDIIEKQMLKEINDAFRAGENYIKDGRYDQAIWSLERVFALDPDPKSQFHENANTLIQEAKAKKAENRR
jgi:tetratricopeptide (TPR) repeat protein